MGGIKRILVPLLFAACAAQAQPVTEQQAATYIHGAFLTDSAPAILSPAVKVGPELAARLGLPAGADSRAVYDALARLTDQPKLSVRKATAAEIASYAPAAALPQPLFVLEAGPTTLLMQYDLAANNVAYVGQLRVPIPPPAPVAVPAPPKPAPPVPVAAPPAPKPAPAVIAPPVIAPPLPQAAPAPPPTPTAPVALPQPVVPAQPPVSRPIDLPAPVAPPLTPPVATPAPPAPVATPTPSPAAGLRPPAKPAPKPAALKPNGPCMPRPVMSEQDLVNCGITGR
jgi:hypothetical protein